MSPAEWNCDAEWVWEPLASMSSVLRDLSIGLHHVAFELADDLTMRAWLDGEEVL